MLKQHPQQLLRTTILSPPPHRKQLLPHNRRKSYPFRTKRAVELMKPYGFEPVKTLKQ